jgi:polysaccharide biosynthesis transport protein
MADERMEIEKLTPAEIAPVELTATRELTPAPYQGYGYGYGYGVDESMRLREMWHIVQKRKWLVITLVLIVTSLVTAEMIRAKAIYQAATIIEIGKDSSTVVKTGDLVINDDSDPQYQVNLRTKMLLLNSRELHEDVAANLKLDQNPRFMQPGEAHSLLGGLRALFGKSEAPADADEMTEEAAQPDETARPAEESARLAPAVEALEENLVIEPMRDTRALRVAFTHTDPAIAAMVANGVAHAFKQRNFQAKTEKFTNTVGWLDSSTRELKAKVEQAEKTLADYTRDHNIFSITDDKQQQTTLTTEKMARLHDQLMRAETDRMLKQTLFQQMKAGQIDQLPDAFADAKLAELQKQLNEQNVQIAQLRVKFGPKNTRVVEAEQQIAAITEQIKMTRGSLEQKLQADYERAVQDEKLLQAAVEQSKTEASRENQDAIQYNILKQDLDTSRALYTDFLQKTNQAKAQVAEQHNNIRVIERAAVPKKPVGPKRTLMIMLAFMVSLAGSIGLVFFLEYLDNTIKNVEDVSRYVQLPALGVIPAMASASKRLSKRSSKTLKGKSRPALSENVRSESLVALDTRSQGAEAYRALRTSVLLSAAGRPPKVILVTSSQPGEGKTTTCVNTAISLAQLGASVLIIDCDLRKPTVHKALQVNHTVGVSTFLSRDVLLEDLVQDLPIANVSVLPCGPIPPNPAELISSERMRQLLATASQRYDHVLVDSPPLINVTDPVILSRMVDGVMLVVHGGKSSRQLVRRARQELASVGAKIFGVVLNNVDLRHESYDGYYGRYTYRYETEETA